MKHNLKLIISALMVLALVFSTTSFAAAEDYQAVSAFSRDKAAIKGCVQNFDIFQFDTGTAYMVTGRCPTDAATNKEITTFDIGKLNKSTKVFTRVGSAVNNISGKKIIGHANSVNIEKYNGQYYILFVEGDRPNMKVGCSKLIIERDDANEIKSWRLDSASTHYITLFPTYQEVPIYSCSVGTSENYLCIATGYGTTKENDRERFHIYDKQKLLQKLTSGNYSQSAFNNIRYATGMFSKTTSLGLNISKANTVIQCIELSEAEDNNLIIFGAIDNRNGMKQHQINRVYIKLNKSGNQLSAQGLDKKKRYYSKVERLQDGASKISMNCKNATITHNFELEGLKQFKGLSAAGVPNGWYLSVHNTYFYKYNRDVSDTKNWYYKIYKAPTLPVINYNK